MSVKPFVKWAGGKGQILSAIQKKYPKNLGSGIHRYCEPFVGGGAVLFDVIANYDIREVLINDINAELINAYKQIRYSVTPLINELNKIEQKFLPLSNEQRKEFYYQRRERFNYLKVNGNDTVNLEKAVLFIFLNKTCFNGLFRVNKQGLFNVPMGSYKRPLICNETNLKMISALLQKVKIICGDYKQTVTFIDESTFVYIDPPYRPLTDTANFTAYDEAPFGDKEQIELQNFVQVLDENGAKVVISNSDPKNTDDKNEFFDDLYKAFSISRVKAKRMINCNGESRGDVSELIITNY